MQTEKGVRIVDDEESVISRSDASPQRRSTRYLSMALLLAIFVCLNLKGPITGKESKDGVVLGHGKDGGEWARCPHQPEPLHPATTWNMTEEDKKVSIERFVQAVVSCLG